MPTDLSVIEQPGMLGPDQDWLVEGALLRAKRFCLWCQEIIVMRVLEKVGALSEPGDPPSPSTAG
jgi:hypothetical protein